MAGAGSTTSSLTSTSHTLTYAPTGMAPTSSLYNLPPARLALLASMEVENRHRFLRPSRETSTASLELAKETLDAFAGQVSDEQQQRLRDGNKKRKREVATASVDRPDVLKIRKLHVEGFETWQVWQQAKRIILSALLESTTALRELEENNEVEVGVDQVKTLEFGEDGFEVGSDDEGEEDPEASQSSLRSDDSDAEEISGVSDEGSEISAQDIGESDLDADGTDGQDEEMEENDGEDEDREGSEDDDAGPSHEYVEDPNGLNDGFFSIDDFNKQTQWFEDQDARADPNTDAASDNDEIDWHADPMAASSSKSKKSSPRRRQEKIGSDIGKDERDDDDDDDDEETGPTFGDMDLDAPEGASDDEFGDGLDRGFRDELDLTANDVFYKDFFAPPARKAKKGSNPEGPKDRWPSQPREYDVEAAMEGVKRDLFEDLSELSGSEGEDALSDVDAGDPKSRRSTHERRQAKIIAEIRKLEAAMVRPKEWTLSGEAAAPERPVNSLLEEDLEFEHVGKPVPVITQEVSESIEEMIKRRIIAQEFDEVPRRLPGSDLLPSSTRRGLVELDDSKAQQGLAELYQEEYIKNTNPDTYVNKSDEKLRKEEKEIEQMWKDISAKLDALSSWHYKPKPVAPSLTVVSDVATVAMEDAQPATAQGVNGSASMLAPQDVYKAGRDTAEKGEIVLPKSGLPLARQEMGREDKVRRRRRQKERIRKGDAMNSSGTGKNKKPVSKKAVERKGVMNDLRKGGVMVINRQGEIMDVDGNKPKAAKTFTSGSFKL